MKTTLLSLAACLLTFFGTAQTQIFFEDFEGGAGGFTLNTATQGSVAGTSGANFWTVNSNYAGGAGTVQTCAPLMGFAFTIPPTPAQPGGITSANGGYLHIISDEANTNGITSASFSPAENSICVFSASHFAEMTNDINTTNFTNVTVDFWWINGSSVSAHGELWYSVDGGTTWTEKTTTSYTGGTTWTNDVLTDPNWDGQTSLRFGFRFDNADANSTADPAFSLDDFLVEGTLGSPCTSSSSAFSETACFTYTVPSGDETYTTTGTMTVMDTILNVAGCDSVMTIDLTIVDVDTSVTTTSSSLTANATGGATFQWLDCANGFAALAGETSSTISATGNFAVEVTNNLCVDTSVCYQISLNIEEFESNEFNIYPNPSQGSISIDLSGLKGPQILSIIDTKGAIVVNENVASGTVISYDLNIERGVYIVRLSDQNGIVRRARLVIE